MMLDTQEACENSKLEFSMSARYSYTTRYATALSASRLNYWNAFRRLLMTGNRGILSTALADC